MIDNAESLLEWLIKRPSDVLPKLSEIGRQLPEPAHGSEVLDMLITLRNHRKISWRNSDGRIRGHHAIRLRSDRVLKTEGCPFEPPQRA
jgi:hypothetical protein